MSQCHAILYSILMICRSAMQFITGSSMLMICRSDVFLLIYSNQNSTNFCLNMMVTLPLSPMSGEAVGAAAIVASRLCKKRLQYNSSIILALDMVHLFTSSHLLFLSDSLSCLQSFQKRDLSLRIFYVACMVIIGWYQCCFMWVPSHIGLTGTRRRM